MKRENVKKNIGIISAFADGKTIQILNERGEWVDLTEREGLPIGILEEEPNNFRIKPEPKCRPFKDAEECWQAMQKHQPFGWIESGGYWYNIISTGVMGVKIIDTRDAVTTLYFGNLLRHYHFADGTTFGVKIEEE